MKLFIALEMTFKCQSRSLAMSYFIRSAGPETGKIRLHLFSDKHRQNDLKSQSRSLSMA